MILCHLIGHEGITTHSIGWIKVFDPYRPLRCKETSLNRNFECIGNHNVDWTGALLWRHNERDGDSNQRPPDCLLNSLIRSNSKKTPKIRVTGLCEVTVHRWPVNSPHKGTVTRKIFPFDDVIMFIAVWRYPDNSQCCLIFIAFYEAVVNSEWWWDIHRVTF